MKARNTIPVLAAALLLLASCAPGATREGRTVTVTGSGAVSVVPDMASIQLAVVTRNSSVTAASGDNARTMTQVQEAIQAAGVPKESFSTSNYIIYQESSYENGRSIPGDYRVSNTLTIVLRDVTKAGSIIDIAIQSGANELSSLSFSVSDTHSAVNEARLLAVEQAEEAAKLLAEAGGARLGKILTLAEESYNRPLYVSNKTLEADGVAGATPVSAAKSDITVTIRAVYALE